MPHPSLPQPGVTNDWGQQLNDGIEARAVPADGADGKVLQRSAGATVWGDPPAGTPGPKGDAGSTPVILPFSWAGALTVQSGSLRIYAEEAITIKKIRASVGTAPTGASIIVDVNKNGTTLFTTQGNRPTIAVGTNTVTAVPAVTSLAAGDYLTLDIDQIGSTVAGADLTVQIEADSVASSLWTKVVDLPMTSLTDWTAGAGTWIAEVDRIRQTGSGSSESRLHYGPLLRQGHCIAEAEVRIDTIGHATLGRAGLFFGSPRSTDGIGAHWVSLNVASGSVASVDFEVDGVAEYANVNLPAPVAVGTWIKMRVHKVGANFEVWIDGTLLTTYELPDRVRELGRVGLKTYGVAASFRNYRFWTPALPE